MVHTKSTIAVAVLALSAATALAAPSYEYSDEIAARDFDDFELEARDFDFDVETRDFENELDARDIFDFEDFEARDFGDDFELQEARDFLEDVEAREFDFGDVQEREFYDFEDVVERAPAPASTSTSSSSTTTPSATTTTHVVKPTDKAKKETKTVVVTTHALPKKCAKPSAMQRLKNFFRKKRASRRKRSQLRAKRRAERKARRNGKATSTTSTSTTSTSTSTSATSTATAATKTLGSEWAQITPPPRKNIPKGVRYTQKRNVGKDKVTTISRTVTAAPTPCPTKAKDGKKRFKREVEDFEDILGRSYEFDELD